MRRDWFLGEVDETELLRKMTRWLALSEMVLQRKDKTGLYRNTMRRACRGTGKMGLHRNTMSRAWRGKTIKRACR